MDDLYQAANEESTTTSNREVIDLLTPKGVVYALLMPLLVGALVTGYGRWIPALGSPWSALVTVGLIVALLTCVLGLVRVLSHRGRYGG